MGRNHARIAALLALVWLPATVALGAQQTEVRITVKDEAGNPVLGMKVVLDALDPQGNSLGRAPLTAKTNKRGVAMFPFLTYNSQGEGKWDLSIDDSSRFIKHFRMESRQLTSQEGGKGTLIQEDQGNAAPKQKLPPLRAKPGGHAELDITVASVGSYTPAAASAGAAAGGGADAVPTPNEAPAAEVEDPITKAKMLAAESKYAEAEDLLKTLKKTEDTAEVNYELARVYHLQERSVEEKSALQETIAKDPAYPRAHYALGRRAYEENRTEEAISHFEAELKSHPDDTQTANALGMLYSEVGRSDDAIRTFEALVAKDPENVDVLVSLDGLYTSKGDAAKSGEIFKRILAQSPEGADQVYYRVGATIAKKPDLTDADRSRAVGAFTKAIQLNPKNPKAHRELGYLYLGSGKIDEAKKEFQAYLQIEPNAKDAGTIKQFLGGS